MRTTIKLQPFEINTDQDATVHAFHNDELIGRVIFQFKADGSHKHRILLDFDYNACLPYHMQARIIDCAAGLVDSHFNDDVDTIDEATVEV